MEPSSFERLINVATRFFKAELNSVLPSSGRRCARCDFVLKSQQILAENCKQQNGS